MKKRKTSPLAEQIKSARIKAGHTQAQAATMMTVSTRSWQYWESGKVGMPINTWHMYQIKTGQTGSAAVVAINNIHNSVAQ